MAQHLAAAREKSLTSHNDEAIRFRRAKLNELWGTFSTDSLMYEAVNAHMESLGYRPVSKQTFYHDKKIVGQERAQVFAEYRETVATQLFERLELLGTSQWDDYEKARKDGGNVAPFSDAVRKTVLTQAQLTGVITQKHEHTGNMTFEMGVKEALAVNPEGERRVVPLLPDEGYGELLPPPIKADG